MVKERLNREGEITTTRKKSFETTIEPRIVLLHTFRGFLQTHLSVQ